MNQLLTVPLHLLDALLFCDPEKGILVWKPRAPELFKNKSRCNSWNARFAYKQAFSELNAAGYYHGRVMGRRLLAHRVIWAFAYGKWPHNHIDHINGNPADNRILNLRVVTRSENRKNSARPNNNTSGVCGVTHFGKKWQAQIRTDRKLIHLGTFPTRDEAVAARKSAEQKYGFHPNHGRDTQCTT